MKNQALCMMTFAAMLTMAIVRARAAESGPDMAVENPQGRLPSVEEIIEHNAVARGGLEAWRAVTSLSEFGRMEAVDLNAVNGAGKERRGARQKMETASRGMSVPFTLHMQRPHKLYLEIQYKGVSAVQVFDGVQGWTVTPSSNGAVVRQYSPEAARTASVQQDLDGPLIDSAAKNTKVLLEGSELVNGRKTYRLKLTLRDGQERHLWIDAETFLDAKIDGTRIVGGTAWPVETYFSAYNKVNGLQIPHILDTSIGGAGTLERIIVDHVSVNPVLSEAIFAAPVSAPARSIARPRQSKGTTNPNATPTGKQSQY